MPRTEEEKVTQAPIRLTLGGEDYDVRPLVIKEARAWRAKLAEVLGKLPEYTRVTTDTPDKFKEGISAMLVSVPDEVVNLVFLYAKELDREAIEATATDAEMAKAFEQIAEVAFPLARGLMGAMAKMAR